jgi:hypothetical protein
MGDIIKIEEGKYCLKINSRIIYVQEYFKILQEHSKLLIPGLGLPQLMFMENEKLVSAIFSNPQLVEPVFGFFIISGGIAIMLGLQLFLMFFSILIK